MAKIKRYDDEFKKSLVDLHLAGKTHLTSVVIMVSLALHSLNG